MGYQSTNLFLHLLSFLFICPVHPYFSYLITCQFLFTLICSLIHVDLFLSLTIFFGIYLCVFYLFSSDFYISHCMLCWHDQRSNCIVNLRLNLKKKITILNITANEFSKIRSSNVCIWLDILI